MPRELRPLPALIDKAFYRCSGPPQTRNLDAVTERGIAMTELSMLSESSLQAELEYRRRMLAVATPRRTRRTRRAAH
jgi:hypothetical protein